MFQLIPETFIDYIFLDLYKIKRVMFDNVIDRNYKIL